MTLLEYSNVQKAFGKKVALHGLSFAVEEGEIFGLLGPNGAGKTTALRILMDIVRADAGQVTLFGEPLKRAALDRVGYLPEERGLYGKQRVIDVMTYFGALKGLRDGELVARARVWLDKVGLREVEKLTIERLSKGMSQKVQLAATLQSEPAICVLDEPFSGLDPVNAVLVKELITEVRRTGRTVILSTHQMGMVESLCDRVALLSNGHLMVYGNVKEVREKQSAREVRVVIDGALPALTGVRSVEREGRGTYRVQLEDETDPQAVLATIVASGVQVQRFERVLASMEDIFIHVVRHGSEAD